MFENGALSPTDKESCRRRFICGCCHFSFGPLISATSYGIERKNPSGSKSPELCDAVKWGQYELGGKWNPPPVTEKPASSCPSSKPLCCQCYEECSCPGDIECFKECYNECIWCCDKCSW